MPKYIGTSTLDLTLSLSYLALGVVHGSGRGDAELTSAELSTPVCSALHLAHIESARAVHGALQACKNRPL